jgi:cholesterol oxidase
MNDSARDTHFDAVIVGSGFGGSVTAYRLAEAGLSVCVLERGKAYPPGEFPRAPHRMQKNVWDPSEGLHGMYNIWSFSELGAVVCSGLGGGSLIYANVLIRKPEKWFVKEDLNNGGFEYWPVTRADLDPHYDRVEEMLDAQQFPIDEEPYNGVPKVREFRDAANRLGLDWRLPNLAVTFGNEGEKPAPGEPIRGGFWDIEGRKRTRYTCRLVGECDIGCNYGSKNTLDYNYLSEAKRLGAEILTRCEVKEFKPRDGGGYEVSYVRHEPEREGQRTDTSRLHRKTLTTDRLILSAGSLGSTFLLLKMKMENRDAFRGISNQLGSRFCGNGDLVTFALNTTKRKDGEQVPRLIDAGYGPVITSRIRFEDREDGGEGRGFYIEDAGYPNFVNWIMETVEVPGEAIQQFWGGIAGRLLDKLLSREPETDIGAEVSRLLGSTEFTADLLPLLGMGRDVPDGRMRLRDDGKLDLDWRVERSQAYFDAIREKMRDVAEELGARFSDPLERLNRVVTVHPLGGCPMGRTPAEGVVNEHGAVFGCPPGLYVADGSVMPGPVGPNPSLTIAALADRFADPIFERKGPEE